MASISDRVGDLGGYLREQREHARLSLRQLAQLAGVSNPYLSQVERGLRNPSAEVLQQIARGLQISAEALYVRAGILESEQKRPDVEAAVHADPDLSDRQKRVLLDIYSAFRAENARSTAEPDEPVPDEPVPAPGRRTAGRATPERTGEATPVGKITKRPRRTARSGGADGLPAADEPAANGSTAADAATGVLAAGIEETTRATAASGTTARHPTVRRQRATSTTGSGPIRRPRRKRDGNGAPAPTNTAADGTTGSETTGSGTAGSETTGSDSTTTITDD